MTWCHCVACRHQWEADGIGDCPACGGSSNLLTCARRIITGGKRPKWCGKPAAPTDVIVGTRRTIPLCEECAAGMRVVVPLREVP